MKVSVFGLGYVGCVSATCLAIDGHEIVGVDVNQQKVKIVNDGKPPIVEKDLAPLVAKARDLGRLMATADHLEAVQQTEVSLVCVGTPYNHNGSQDLTYLRRVAGEIGDALRAKHGHHHVVLRSTILPGTTEQEIIPILEQHSGKENGVGFDVSFNPEFMREGNSISDFRNPPFTIVGEMGPGRSTAVMSDLYHSVAAPLIFTSVRAAEMIKYANNAWHALKVAFANEMGALCKHNGIDSHELMSIFCRDTKLNISPAYLRPGFAFGGSCLPKELRALDHHARHCDLELPLLESILLSNEAHLHRGLDMIVHSGKRKIGLLGLSFKSETDDLRESPLVALAERLIGKGYQLRIFDRNVSLARLMGSNREYIEKEIPHIAELLVPTLEEILKWAEVIVIGNEAAEFERVLTAASAGQIIIDLVRIEDDLKSRLDQYQGVCW